MPYARFDDRYDDHPKIKRALRREPAAVALHAMAITYCNRHNSDGEVDIDWVEEKLALIPFKPAHKRRVLSVLVELNLFERKDDATFVVHDFLDWNLSREQRENLAEQGRRGGRAKAAGSSHPDGNGSSRGSSQGLSQGSSGGSSTPTPTPTPTKTSLSDTGGADEKTSEDDHRLCKLLRDLATQRNPKFKVRSRNRWLTDMRLLRERDDNSPEEIERLIQWLFTDGGRDAEFWADVIRSPANLREHFAEMWAKMTRPRLVPAVEDSASFLRRKGVA